MLILLIVFCLLRIIDCGLYAPGQYYEKNDYQKISDALFNGYNSDGWPANNQVEVQTSLSILALQLVSEITSSVVIKVVLRMGWEDTRLRWDPNDYNGINQITVNQHLKGKRAWMPDITCTTLNGKISFPDLDFTLIQVSYTGECYWSRPGSMNIAQKFALKNFPYDVQKIKMIFESWLSPDDKQKLVAYKENSSFKVIQIDAYYCDHLQWDIQNLSSRLQTQKYTSGTYSQIIFEMDIVRRGGMIETIVLLPGILISFMCVFAFALPRQAPIRLIFQNSVMMTMIMFTKMVTQFLPVSNDKPFIEKIFTTLFIYVNVVVCFIVWSQNFYIKSAAYLNKVKPAELPYQRYDKKISTVLLLLPEQNKGANKDIDQQKKEIEQQIAKEIEQELKKDFVLRCWLLKPSNIDTLGYLAITIGGFAGMYSGIKSIQF